MSARRITYGTASEGVGILGRLIDRTSSLLETANWYIENEPGDAPEIYGRLERSRFREQGGREEWKRDLDKLDAAVDDVLAWLGDRRVRLTELERRTLLQAASEVVGHPDAIEANFDEQETRAVMRAYRKLGGTP